MFNNYFKKLFFIAILVFNIKFSLTMNFIKKLNSKLAIKTLKYTQRNYGQKSINFNYLNSKSQLPNISERTIDIELIENVKNKNLNKTQKSLESDADPNATADLLYNSALHYACNINSIEIAKVLLKYKANPNLVNKENGTPLVYACKAGSQSNININLELINFLLNSGANPNIETLEEREVKESPLINAYYSKDKEAIELLLKNGACPLEITENIILNQMYEPNHSIDAKNKEIYKLFLEYSNMFPWKQNKKILALINKIKPKQISFTVKNELYKKPWTEIKEIKDLMPKLNLET